jgi:ABC-type transport system involved in multi-copper enzyme maturation permease subunit
MTLLAMTMTALPGAILWLGQQLTQDKARQAMVDNIGDLGKVLVLGLLVSLMYGTIGLMISSFTNRKGVAIAIILIGFLVVTGTAQGLSVALEDYEWSKWFLLADLNTVTLTLSDNFFDDVQGNTFVERLGLTQTGAILVMLGYALVASLVLRWRYSARDDV